MGNLVANYNHPLFPDWTEICKSVKIICKISREISQKYEIHIWFDIRNIIHFIPVNSFMHAQKSECDIFKSQWSTNNSCNECKIC